MIADAMLLTPRFPITQTTMRTCFAFSQSEYSQFATLMCDYTVTKFGTIIVNPGWMLDSRNRSIQFAFYKHADGIRIRRMIPCMRNMYYQLNRNTRTNEWPAFQSLNDALNWFDCYLDKVAEKMMYAA